MKDKIKFCSHCNKEFNIKGFCLEGFINGAKHWFCSFECHDTYKDNMEGA